MYRRKPRQVSTTKSSSLSLSFNRGSDIKKPENTSLIVNRSQQSEELTDELPKSLTSCLLSDDEDEKGEITSDEPTTTHSVMQAMSQKLQSTRRETNISSGSVLRERNKYKDPESPILISSGSSRSSKMNSPQKLDMIAPLRSLSNNKNEGSLPVLKNSYFTDLLADCNVIELPGEASFQLADDQTLFAIKLNKILEKSTDSTEKFLKSLEEYISNDKRLKKLLVMTQTASDCETARGAVQDPMLRILLQMDTIQSGMLKLVRKTLTNMLNNKGENIDQQLVTAILRQVRFINREHDSNFGSKLLQLIKQSPVSVKKEIIFMLPELVVEGEAEEATKQLIEMLECDATLTPVIVDALTNLPLNQSLKNQVRNKLFIRMETSPIEHVPLLVKFCINRCDNGDAFRIVSDLREALSSTHLNLEGADLFVKMIFENLKYSVMISKSMTDAWMKVISNIESSKSFKPIDFMILVLINGCVIGRKSTTITLFKNRIKSGILSGNQIEMAFKELKIVISEYAKEIIDLASCLLKSFEQVVIDTTMVIYKEAFVYFGPFLRQDLIVDLVNHISTGESCSVHAAITILQTLKNLYHSDLELYTCSILSILGRVTDLDVMHVRQLIDILASLVFKSTTAASTTTDEIEIFTRKLVSSPIPEIQRKGIVCALTLAKYNAGVENNQANSLLKMALGSQKTSDHRQGFFYDELAMIIKQSNLDKMFVSYWKDYALKSLKQRAFVRDLDFQCNHFPMSVQYALECEQQLVFPIVAFIVDSSATGDLTATLIPSVFRLLWSASSKSSDILPFLCAGVILPDPEVFDDFLKYDVTQQKMIMDCLFLCANYFLECINAFCTQTTTEKVIIRFKQFMEVRGLIIQFLEEVPDYTPPICQFHIPSVKPNFKKKPLEGAKKKPRGRKRKSDGTEMEANPENTLDTSSNSSNTQAQHEALPSTAREPAAEAVARVSAAGVSSSANVCRLFLRTLQCHTFRLLRVELKLSATRVFKKKKTSDLMACNVSWSYRPEEKPELGPAEILFLLQEYSQKLEVILSTPRPAFLAKSKPVGLIFEQITAEVFLQGTLKLFPKLYSKLEFVHHQCQELIEGNNGLWDPPGMFTSNFNDIKLIYSAIVKIIADLLAWPGLLNPSHKATLTEMFKVLGGNRVAETSSQSQTDYAESAANNLSSFIQTMPLLSGAISIVKAVQSCIKQSESPSDQTLVAKLCNELLQRPWFTLTGNGDCGPHYNQQIDSVLRTYFATVDDKLDAVRKIAEMAAEEASSLIAKDTPMSTYKSLNKGNFPLLYRALCEALIASSSETLTKLGSDNESCIHVWATITRILMYLIDIVKVQTNRMNLATILKRSQAIIQMFLSKGLPVMESALRVKSDQVLKILKSIQSVTRFLHSVCCHSKVTNDGVVGAHVPNIRSLCERLTLEVKGMLISNKIPLDCITIAVLKNRDIQGNDILSQTPPLDDDTEESELLPEESEEPMEDVEMETD